MDIKDLLNSTEMKNGLEELRGNYDIPHAMIKELCSSVFNPKEELRKLEKALAKEWTVEIEQNPLSAYSTTELKKELRRRKGKIK